MKVGIRDFPFVKLGFRDFPYMKLGIRDFPCMKLGIRDFSYLKLGIRDFPYMKLGIREFPYLKLGIRVLKQNQGEFRDWRCDDEKTIRFKELHEILGRDYRIEEPCWGISRLR